MVWTYCSVSILDCFQCFNSTSFIHLPFHLNTPTSHMRSSAYHRDHPLLHPAPLLPSSSFSTGDQGGFQHLPRQFAMDSTTKTQWSLASPRTLDRNQSWQPISVFSKEHLESGKVRQREILFVFWTTHLKQIRFCTWNPNRHFSQIFCCSKKTESTQWKKTWMRGRPRKVRRYFFACLCRFP